jgi:hypothetical protein
VDHAQARECTGEFQAPNASNEVKEFEAGSMGEELGTSPGPG